MGVIGFKVTFVSAALKEQIIWKIGEEGGGIIKSRSKTLLNVKMLMLDKLFLVVLQCICILQESICRNQITTDDATDSSVFKIWL